MFKHSLTATATTVALALATATAALAGDGLDITDAYARASGPHAKAGAAFMVIENHGSSDDQLIGASSDVAKRVELHTHIDKGDGVMQMREVEGGFAIPAGGAHALKRGGDHVMFMGLTRPLNQGDVVEVILTFEQAGDVTVEIPVDLERKDGHAHAHQGGHTHGN
ncbi:MAG: copper chaperone PCu(A)C [Marinibacterium sp.]|nr:copper chaperone PCu(A)C [Marinibacterium sp.]